jgi:hypothetical protein
LRSFLAYFAAAALLCCLSACGHKAAPAPTAGTIMVENFYAGLCSSGKHKICSITASVDGRPPVPVALGAKFEFANISLGSHVLNIASKGAPFEKGGFARTCSITVAASGSYTVVLGCGVHGSVSVAGP